MDARLQKERVSCSCRVCVNMCRRKPCWGTPDDIEGLLHYGVHPMNFMLEMTMSGIEMIQPAVAGFTHVLHPVLSPMGRCALLKDDRCTVHDTGFKPTEGALAMHTDEILEKDPVHIAVAESWQSDKGKNLVTQWKRIMSGGN